ncbi:translation initiation factor IF-2 [Candidatus Riesia pediculicola]|uniref:Translation initiation factor IF-2 n=1 Tax=Riesia pediculicola (strain USDA) TaxID=515618 RepID=D4G865_RIEPU|nr:translation initiation factor IF-2 [Candidatus Riesia pediculicola]ADD79485.1 translation initiation factor IF-2 [Candidatus Riesia pediculicola USDA]ARC53769.1 hypothetical protein AOE55_01210 [Candidatus Riesia pediculicola]QOJ86407.1 translation initiation factor IF-2 [Candidatus Riesia pediculicola]
MQIDQNERDIEFEIVRYRDYMLRKYKGILKSRPPIVSVVGHIDHGKTSLLDKICSTEISSKEIGGITQKINAYYFQINDDQKKSSITFLDTPGHSAFYKMRLRGINITDIVLLVIAMDDGIMSQTIESIQYAKSFKIPIIVAVNKIDIKKNYDKDIENHILQYGVQSERLGGENQFIYVSAKTGEGVHELLDAILIQSEMMELKALQNCPAKGIVIESHLDNRRGPIANIIVKEGTLRKGDVILCGFEYGRVKDIRDLNGKNVEDAFPSLPVQILGLSDVPLAGDDLIVLQDEKKAKDFALLRKNKFREIKLDNQKKCFEKENEGAFLKGDEKIISLNIILKTDTQGILDTIQNSLEERNRSLRLKKTHSQVKIVEKGVGRINNNDIILAITSKSIIFGFNVQIDHSSKNLLKKKFVDIRNHSIIYELLKEIDMEMNKIERKSFNDKIQIGKLYVKNIFKSSKDRGVIVGCMVSSGKIRKDSIISIFRDKKVIFRNIQIDSLKRFQNNVLEVREGVECGIKIKSFVNLQIGDKIIVFE